MTTNPGLLFKRARGRPYGSTTKGRRRHLTLDELQRFFAAARTIGLQAELMMRLTYYLALRAKELVELQRDAFNEDREGVWVTVVGAKEGDERIYPLPASIARLWRRWLKEQTIGRYVFPHRDFPDQEPMTREGAKSLFRRVARKAGISGHSIHDLRHSMAQHMADSGEPQVRVASWLRHKDSASASRYISTAEDVVHGLKMRDWYDKRGG